MYHGDLEMGADWIKNTTTSFDDNGTLFSMNGVENINAPGEGSCESMCLENLLQFICNATLLMIDELFWEESTMSVQEFFDWLQYVVMETTGSSLSLRGFGRLGSGLSVISMGMEFFLVVENVTFSMQTFGAIWLALKFSDRYSVRYDLP